MKSNEEKVLLFHFDDDKKIAVEAVMRGLKIKTISLSNDSFNEKIGFLLGTKGFVPNGNITSEPFDFPHEVMIFRNIQGKRLDEVLKAMRDAGIPPVRYKAVVTPYNILWTLKKLCMTMQKEHAYMAEREREDIKK